MLPRDWRPAFAMTRHTVAIIPALVNEQQPPRCRVQLGAETQAGGLMGNALGSQRKWSPGA